ncbi:MAG: hypothetical protein ACR2PV_03970 [Gammaproteobacteria bacterium]
MAKSKTASIKKDNAELMIRHSETDAPIIPVENIERLHGFRPDLVDWLINQTQTEASHRRRRETRIDFFIFTHNILGQIFAFIIGLAGVMSGAYIVVHGHALIGSIIAGITIVGLVAVFLTGKKR